MRSGVSTLVLILLLQACATGISSTDETGCWPIAEDLNEPQLPITGYAFSPGRSQATLECSRLTSIADGVIGSRCLIVDVAGELVDLNRAASQWEWAVRAAPECQPVENERRTVGAATRFEIDFVGSMVDRCMKNSVVSVDVMPQSGERYTLITQLD